MNSIGCAPRQGPRQGPDRWDASSHSEKGNLHVAASESFTACGYLNIAAFYHVLPWFDVIGILSGFARYADVTDVHVTCTQFCPVATLMVFPGLSVLFFLLAFFTC